VPRQSKHTQDRDEKTAFTALVIMERPAPFRSVVDWAARRTPNRSSELLCERSRSMTRIMRYVGMDVHAETIAIAVVDADGTDLAVRLQSGRTDRVTAVGT